jgi:hypothetical protein
MTTLRDLLREKEAAIAERWLGDALGVYPPDAAALFRREKDPFANPVGCALRTGTRAILEGLAGGADVETLGRGLEDIIRMRAVQELSPSQAVSFVFLLKDAVRAELQKELGDPGLASEMAKLDAQVDRLALLALDLYVRCRERVYELRVNEVKRGVSSVVEMINRRESGDRPDARSAPEFPRGGGGP